MSQYHVRRFISRFEKNNELSFFEIPFKVEPPLEELQDICGTEMDDQIYEEVELNEEKLEKLRAFVESDFDLKRYVYFLSCVDMTD